jgi:hypothetical protein
MSTTAVSKRNVSVLRVVDPPQDPTPLTLQALNGAISAIKELLSEMDRRYEQRFIAAQEAIQAALLAQKEAVASALMAADRALSKAELANEKRFESVNEFRSTLSDQARELMPRNESMSMMAAMASKMSELADRFNRLEGQGLGVSSANVNRDTNKRDVTGMIGVGIAVATLALIFLRDMVTK